MNQVRQQYSLNMLLCMTFLLFLVLLSCGPPDPVLKYSLDTPPLILTPTDNAAIP